MKFDSVDDILDFAIKNEEGAAAFYTDLAAKMDNPSMSKVFEGFAKEEQGHKAKLVAIKEGKKMAPAKEKVLDLQIGDYLVPEEPTGDLDYQGALILAMKKEKAAFKLYSDLASSTDVDEIRITFLQLAQEEAKHKLRFEVEYDENVLREN